MLFVGVLTFAVSVSGAAGLLSFGPPPAHSQQQPTPVSATAPASAPVPEALWVAAAPGRVEPKGRELHIAASAPAAIKEVLVDLNDRVKAGDLLIRLDDGDLRAKLAAVKAEAAVQAAGRDTDKVKGLALDRRKAEDALYTAERNAFDTRMELDRLISLSRKNEVAAEEVEQGRNAVKAADEKVERERANLKRVQEKNLPSLTREEASLAAARAEVAVVSTAIEHMRLRAPADASVLELHAKIGEMANPSGEVPLLVLGDTVHLQVRAEVEERDVRKIYAGQAAIVKSDAFPARSFEARVAVMARSLGTPQLSARGQRKQTDVDVLEVVLDLDDDVPLLPGMRTDVLFKEAEAMQKSSSVKTQ
jgi:HlyD family secretion protein